MFIIDKDRLEKLAVKLRVKRKDPYSDESFEERVLRALRNKRDSEFGINEKKTITRLGGVDMFLSKGGVLWKKELAHKSFSESVKYLTAKRKNYYFENLVLKKQVLETNLKVLELLTYIGHKFFIITEFEKLKKRFLIHQGRRSLRYTYKNLWLQGHLLRHSLDTKAEEERERDRLGLKRIDDKWRKWPFPHSIITLSKLDRIIPILEARKLNLTTFSFSHYNTEEFAKSEYKFAVNINKKHHEEVIYWLIYETIVNVRPLIMRAPNLFFRTALRKLTNFNKKIYRKFKKSYVVARETKAFFKPLKKFLKKRKLSWKYYKLRKRRWKKFFFRCTRVRGSRTRLAMELMESYMTTIKSKTLFKIIKRKPKLKNPNKKIIKVKMQKKKYSSKRNCPLSDLNRYSNKRTKF